MQAAIAPRTFLRVTGPDAEAYLQGQLSQDVSTGGGLSFLLDPSGKVVALLRFVRTGGDFQLDTDPEVGDAVANRLRRFLLRTKAEIEPVDGVQLLRVFDGPALPQAQIVTAWPPDAGVQDVFTPDPEADLAALGAERLDDDGYQRRRIEAGVPVSGVDIGPDTIPAEVGRWAIDAAVSFTKGCFTGQELVARIDSRGGNVPRPVRVLRFESPVTTGVEVTTPDGQAAGRITSAAAEWAMAPLARRVDVGDALVAGGVAGTVHR